MLLQAVDPLRTDHGWYRLDFRAFGCFGRCRLHPGGGCQQTDSDQAPATDFSTHTVLLAVSRHSLPTPNSYQVESQANVSTIMDWGDRDPFARATRFFFTPSSPGIFFGATAHVSNTPEKVAHLFRIRGQG